MARLLAEQARRSVSRRELAERHAQFTALSPEVGAIDESAFGRLLEDRPDDAAELIVAMAQATDRDLRRSARALSRRLVLPAALDPADCAPGAAKLRPVRAASIDVDVDTTITNVVQQDRPLAEAISWQAWQRPARAVVLAVDASGSVTGAPLATAVVTACALAARLRPVDELAVVAFWSRPVLLRPMGSPEPFDAVIDALLDLRGGDTTDIAAAVELALAQAVSARAARRDVVVLTDGLVTAGADPLGPAGAAANCGARIHVLALSDDATATAACTSLADSGGGRMAPVANPAAATAAVWDVLGRGGC